MKRDLNQCKECKLYFPKELKNGMCVICNEEAEE